MPYPFLHRIQLDANQLHSSYLGNTKYAVDFVPTRDKTVPKGELCIFKRCADEFEVHPTATTRGYLEPFLGQVFGQIDLCSTSGLPGSVQANTRVVRLKCPDNVSCQTKRAYYMQIETLSAALDEDSSLLSGNVGSTWFAIAQGSCYPHVEGCFYIVVPPRFELTLPVGELIEMLVTLKRLDSREKKSSLTVHFLFSRGLLMKPFYRPTIMATAYLAAYSKGGLRSTAFAAYPADFVATREASTADGSLYTYKLTRAAEETPTAYRRGVLRKYEGAVFGELRGIKKLGDESGIVLVELQCPSNAWCSAVEIYASQMRLFHSVLETDVGQLSTRPNETLFASDGSDGEFRHRRINVYVRTRSRLEIEELMYALQRGMKLEADVSLQRIDSSPDDISNVREYRLLASVLLGLDRQDIPERGLEYECDRGTMSFVASFYSASEIGESSYPSDFAAVRYSSTRDNLGSVYIYRPLKNNWPTFYGSNRRYSLPSFTVPFSGCVISVVTNAGRVGSSFTNVTLGLPANHNATAAELITRQESFLKHISDTDTRDAGCACIASWGNGETQCFTPTVVISMPNVKLIQNEDFKVGDDLTITTRLKRFDRLEGSTWFLTVLSFVCSSMLCLREVASDTDPSALGNCVPFKDFIPTRDGSCCGDSHFSYKVAAEEASPTAENRGRLLSFFPYIFGTVDWIGETILDYEADDTGGFIRSTWFEGDGMEHTVTEGAIYITIEDDGGMMDSQILLNELCVLWVTLHRMDYDIMAGSPDKVYKLESDFFSWIPSDDADKKLQDYTCDLGLSNCTFC
ncbi:hypothetical protein B0H13DRAFT_2500641 [Mycena leptocephala]|nr:hypothetical protein B0H13DRAFT_2500641 [Mycena leptocephala]